MTEQLKPKQTWLLGVVWVSVAVAMLANLITLALMWS